jgi:hypothetical protein
MDANRRMGAGVSPAIKIGTISVIESDKENSAVQHL